LLFQHLVRACFADHPEGAGFQRSDRVDFDRRVRLEFRGAQISSDGGLLVMRKLDDAPGCLALRLHRCTTTAGARTPSIVLTGYSGNRSVGGWPDTGMSTTLTISPSIR